MHLGWPPRKYRTETRLAPTVKIDSNNKDRSGGFYWAFISDWRFIGKIRTHFGLPGRPAWPI